MMIAQNFMVLASLVVMAAAGPATAIGLEDLASCYTRGYSINEQDTVQNIERLSLTVDAAQLGVTLIGINRLEQSGYLHFNCYEQSGSVTDDPKCGTFELESSISITE